MTLRAAGCALAMQATLRDYASDEGIRLSLRVGLGAGEVVLLDVGGVRDRRELLVSGSAVPQTTGASTKAQPDQVLVAPGAWALLADVCAGERVAGGVRLRWAPAPPAKEPPLPPPPAGLDALLVPYLPRALLGSLRAGHGEWLAELRRVTLAFVNLPGLDHTATLDRAQRTMQALQTALYRYEGSVNKLSVDDKGTVLVAAIGLPPLAHEDDPARGVKAALAMQARIADHDLVLKLGVHAGPSVVVTMNDRLDYFGSTVNMAARLQGQSAGGDIVLSRTVADDPAVQPLLAGGQTREESVALKGFSDPIRFVRLTPS
jgi:class 3 adenylate cyclase